MRTSNKLLIAFVAFVVLLMLCSDIVMWANFRNGKTGDDNLSDHQSKWKTQALQPVNVVKIESRHAIDITTSDKYELAFNDDDHGQVLYSQKNDTLFLQPSDDKRIILKCPDIQSLLIPSGGDVNIYNLNTRNLYIQLNDSSHLQLTESKVKSLRIAGLTSNELRITAGTVDSLYLQLGKGSRFFSEDVPYQFTSMKLDSLQDLQLTGRSINALKEIR